MKLLLLILPCIWLVGCCTQKTSARLPNGVVIQSQSTTFLKDMQAQFRPDANDPNKMVLTVQGGSSGPVDVVLAGLGVLVGLFL